jgi:hypothetical protein
LICRSSPSAKSFAAYERELLKHQESAQDFRFAESDFHKAVQELGNETEKCMKLLKDAGDLVERLSYSEIQSSIPELPIFSPPDMCTIGTVLADFNAAIEAGKGAGLGIATSTGAWILVAHLGTASTGAAIAGLSGAAAHSAILAWFGGGAIAAGGGGMLLGTSAVGGLVALPLLAFSAYKSYTEASRIDDERVKVIEAYTRNSQGVENLKSLRANVLQLRQSLIERRSGFVLEYREVREEASLLAYKMASAANSFALFLVTSSRERGAV